VRQDLSSIFSFTVKDIVLMGRNPYIGLMSGETKKDLEILKNVLASCDLTGFKDRPIDELSSGERQRVLLAKALAQEPKILLLDEPTAHLDIGYQIAMLDFISSIRESQDLTVICVLHDLNLASQYCDRLLLLQKGRIAGMGPAKEIIEDELIEKIFGVNSLIIDGMINGQPAVIPVSKKKRQKST